MALENSGWHPKRMSCPNCGNTVIGMEDKDGCTKMTCSRCRTVLVRRMMSRRHAKIDVYLPGELEVI